MDKNHGKNNTVAYKLGNSTGWFKERLCLFM